MVLATTEINAKMTKINARTNLVCKMTPELTRQTESNVDCAQYLSSKCT